MKSILLYAMPRSRSSAILSSAKSENKIFEPFNFHRIQNLTNTATLEQTKKAVTDFYYRENILPLLPMDNTAIKMLAIECYFFDEAKKFLSEIQNNQSHEIFIIVRDLREALWSQLISTVHGSFYSEESTSENKQYMIAAQECYSMFSQIKTFLDNLPKYGHLISWDHLPSKYFDKNLNKVKNQHSQDKKNTIINLDFCDQAVESVIKIYQSQWEDKVLTKPWAPL